MTDRTRTGPVRGLQWVALAATLGALAACGGGGGYDDGGAPGGSGGVPPSATASVTAFVQYLAALAMREAEEPLSVDGVTPPTSDTDEPVPLT